MVLSHVVPEDTWEKDDATQTMFKKVCCNGSHFWNKIYRFPAIDNLRLGKDNCRPNLPVSLKDALRAHVRSSRREYGSYCSSSESQGHRGDMICYNSLVVGKDEQTGS